MQTIFLALFFLFPELEHSTIEKYYTVQEVKVAIQKVAPQLSRRLVRHYAKIVHKVTSRRRIDPLLLVAFITHESQWKSNLRSSTNDYGLGQVHVSANGSAKFLGREKELYRPLTNLQEWSRLAEMWRAYHDRTCDDKHHSWWKHMKWGYKIKNLKPTKVDVLYQQLKQMFILRRSEV